MTLDEILLGSPMTKQDVADALLLAPSGTANSGSVMSKLSDLPATDTIDNVKYAKTTSYGFSGEVFTDTITDMMSAFQNFFHENDASGFTIGSLALRSLQSDYKPLVGSDGVTQVDLRQIYGRGFVDPGATPVVGTHLGAANTIAVDSSGNVRAVDSNGNPIAPAATALSNATWTDAKAGYLDAAVSSLGSPMQTGEVVALAAHQHVIVDSGTVTSVADPVTVGVNNDKTGYSIDGASGGVGPTACEAAEDIYVTAFKNGTASLYARVYKNGVDIHRADVSTLTYSVYLLDGDDPDARTAATGHDGVALDAADVIFDTVQSDAEASNYNFRHTIPIGEHPPFTIAGRNCLAEYVITSTAGEKIIVRFRIEVK